MHRRIHPTQSTGCHELTCDEGMVETDGINETEGVSEGWLVGQLDTDGFSEGLFDGWPEG